MRLCNRAPHNLVKYTVLCDIVHCNLRLLFIILFNQVEHQTLGAIPPHHPFSILYTSHLTPLISASCISAPIHPYSRFATDCNSAAASKFTLIGTLFGCISLISSILYNTHPYPSISTFSQYFSLCSSVVSSLVSNYYLSPCNLLFPLPLPLVQTLPFPLCCNKNFVKLNLFVSLALAKRTTSKVK